MPGQQLKTAETLGAGTHWSDVVGLWDNKSNHAIEYVVAGSGTIAITPYTSISGKDWISNGGVVSGAGSTGGPDADGKNNIPLNLYPSDFVKFKIVVSSASVVFSLWFVQK